MASVRDVTTVSRPLDAPLPTDSEQLFDTLMDDPKLDTPDMQVEGDWTFRQFANHLSAKEYIEGQSTNWDQFREIEWDAEPNLLQTQSLFDIGTAADPQSSFGSGDPGIGVTFGRGYYGYGEAGDSSGLSYDGNVITSATEGERSVAWNAPNGVELAQLINQQDWSHQASVVAALITNLPGLGNSSNWAIPSYYTVDGRRSFLGAYSYSYSGAALGVPLFESTFSIRSPQARTFTFSLLDGAGDTVTTTDVDVESGGQDVKVTWVNAPPSGYTTIDSNGLDFTIQDTNATPPPL